MKNLTHEIAIFSLVLGLAYNILAADHGDPGTGGGPCGTESNGSTTCAGTVGTYKSCPNGYQPSTPINSYQCQSADGTKLYYKTEANKISDCTNLTSENCCKEITSPNQCLKKWFIQCNTKTRKQTCTKGGSSETQEFEYTVCVDSDPQYEESGDLDGSTMTDC